MTWPDVTDATARAAVCRLADRWSLVARASWRPRSRRYRFDLGALVRLGDADPAAGRPPPSPPPSGLDAAAPDRRRTRSPTPGGRPSAGSTPPRVRARRSPAPCATRTSAGTWSSPWSADLSGGDPVFAQRAAARRPPPRPPSCSPRRRLWSRSAPTTRSAPRVVAAAAAAGSCSSAAATRYLASKPAGRRQPIPPAPTSRPWPARPRKALRADGRRRVRLGYDDSLFTGPAVNPHWPAGLRPRRRGRPDHRALGRRGPPGRSASVGWPTPPRPRPPGSPRPCPRPA